MNAMHACICLNFCVTFLVTCCVSCSMLFVCIVVICFYDFVQFYDFPYHLPVSSARVGSACSRAAKPVS